MKNNYVSSLQFYSSMFLSVIISVLFISFDTSLYSIVLLLLASVVNLTIFMLYDGTPGFFLKIFLYIYFVLISVNVVDRLSRYMHIILNSGPYWAIVPIILITSFFCAVKGFEVLSRAGLIISVFTVVFLLYILIEPFYSTDYSKLNVEFNFDVLPALIMLYPSVCYMVQNKKIRGEKTSHQVVFSLMSFLTVGLFLLFSSSIGNIYPVHYLAKSVRYGVFKGGDCLLLALLTVSVLFVIANSALAVCDNSKKHSINLAVFVGIVLILSLLSAYFHNIQGLILNDLVLLVSSFTVLLIGFVALCTTKYKKN